MTQQPISNEIALRIGLAAHRIPGVEVPGLIKALKSRLGPALDASTLGRITVTHLKESLKHTYNLDGEEDGGESPDNADIAAFKDAVRILWGEQVDSELPSLDAAADEDLPRSVRIAVASNEGEQMDGHFGSCLRFLVYQVSADEIRLVDVRSTLPCDLTNDKNSARVDLIRDCRVVYMVSIGGPAMAKVIKADIHISQHPEGGDARAPLMRLQEVLRGTPPPWLAKALDGNTARAAS